jgi:hypothetical protein
MEQTVVYRNSTVVCTWPPSQVLHLNVCEGGAASAFRSCIIHVFIYAQEINGPRCLSGQMKCVFSVSLAFNLFFFDFQAVVTEIANGMHAANVAMTSYI